MEESALGKKKEKVFDASATAVGARAAQLRKARGITQREMAERLGITQPHVSFYERGEARIHAEMLAKLASILEVSSDELLDLSPPRAKLPAEVTEQRQLWRRFQQIARLSERDQRAVIRMINALSGLHES